MRGQVLLGSAHSAEMLRSPVTVGSANPRTGNRRAMHSFVHEYNINSWRSRQVSRDFSPKHWDTTKFEWVGIKIPDLRRALKLEWSACSRPMRAASSLVFHIDLRRCPVLQCVNRNTLERRAKMFQNKHERRTWGLFYTSQFYYLRYSDRSRSTCYCNIS